MAAADLDSDLDLSLILHALSDPQRRTIIRELAASDEPVPCGQIELGVGKSTRTHHFRVLREAGLIEQRRDGTRKLTSLRREEIDAKFPGLLDAVLVPVSAQLAAAPTAGRHSLRSAAARSGG